MNAPLPRPAASAPAPGASRDKLPTRHDIERLVDRFYERVQRDPVLGPVFNPAIEDWNEHKRTLVSFWSSVVLRSGTYRGQPMAAHRPHPIRAAHFDHWLALWRDTAESVLVPEHAALLCEYAARIGRSLRYGLGIDDLPDAQARR
jgi:hemoglobin